MASKGVTTFLGLRKILLQNSDWFADAMYNLERTDLLGLHVNVQDGVGQPLKLRFKKSDGTLVDFVTVTQNSEKDLDISIGRAKTNDAVFFSSSNFVFNSLRLRDSSSLGGVKFFGSTLSNSEAEFTFFTVETKALQFTTPRIPTTANEYAGSAIQFEQDPTGALATNPQWVSFNVLSFASVNARFIQPTYKL